MRIKALRIKFKKDLEKKIVNELIKPNNKTSTNKANYPDELKNLNALLKALKKQLEVNKFDKLPKDDYIRIRISKQEKEYLKQFCTNNNIKGGISGLIRMSVHAFICRKELENGKK